MQAVDEIGLKKTSMFIIYSFVQVIYHLLIDHLLYFPQARKFFLVALGSKIGNESQVMNVKFFNWHHTGPSGLKIGNFCFIGDETLFDLYDQVILEDQVTLAQRVTVLTHLNVGYQSHPLQKYFPKTKKPVIFKRGCVVAAAATILPGVTIGEESFVASGSVVVNDVPPKTLVAGVPAKIVRSIK